jgi:hypothetical protein
MLRTLAFESRCQPRNLGQDYNLEYAVEDADFDAVHREHDSVFCYACLDDHEGQPCIQVSCQTGGIVTKGLVAGVTEDYTHQCACQHVNLVQRNMSQI